MFSIFATPLGWVMKGCYALIQNYGVALFVFTLITRLVTLPLQIKQQKSSARMALLNPEMDKIRKKYGKNKEKMQEEQMKLYSKYGVNPMASCLPMVISMLILFSMIPVIYAPLTYVSNLDKDVLSKNNTMITNLYTISTEISAKDTTLEKMLTQYEKDGAEDVYEKLKETLKDSDNYKSSSKIVENTTQWEDVVSAIEKHNDIDQFMTNEKYVSKSIAQSRPELVTFDFVDKSKDDAKFADILPDSIRQEAENFDYTFFGLSLGTIPEVKSPLVLIPLLSFIFQLLVTIVSQKYMKKNNPSAAEMGGAMGKMLYIMPLFSLWIAFSYPAGLGLYWIYSSVIGLVQTIFLNTFYTPEKVQEMIKKDDANKKKKNKKSFMERAVEMQNAQNGTSAKSDSDDYVDVDSKDVDDDSDLDLDDDGEEKKLSKSQQKDAQRKKLNEARRRMAEKYGEEYDDKDKK